MLVILWNISVVVFGLIILCCSRVLYLGVVFIREVLVVGWVRDVESVQGVIGLLVFTVCGVADGVGMLGL